MNLLEELKATIIRNLTANHKFGTFEFAISTEEMEDGYHRVVADNEVITVFMGLSVERLDEAKELPPALTIDLGTQED